MHLPGSSRAAAPAFLFTTASLLSLVSTQTIKSGGEVVAANEDTVAPAAQNIQQKAPQDGAQYFDFETLQLTPEVLANLTSHELTNIDAFKFADDESNSKRSGPHRDRCRVMPDDSDWPNHSEWFVLNLLTGGALIEGRPQAAACYEDWREYDVDDCQNITASWPDPHFHCDAPTGIDWPLYEGITCLPPSVGPPGATCTLGGFPSYVVKVSNVAQIQLAMNFARNLNLRLIVKNKGHDFNAKSTGAGALSVWTHFLDEIEYIPSYRTAESDGPALKIGAGVDVISLYKFADAHDLEAVGGIGRTVGVGGGYSSGGGHSPLISLRGMGADQILGLHVVLPDGRFVFADEHHHQDLFWAIRGGGGATYGVVTSLIYRAYPKTPVSTLTYSFGTSDKVDTETFWKGMDVFWATFPDMADAGHYRYFFLNCMNSTSCSLAMNPHWANGMTAAELKEFNAPFFSRLKDLGIEVTDAAYKEYPGLLDAFESTFPPEGERMGSWTSHVGSRLWPRSNWEDPDKLAAQSKAIRDATEKHIGIIAYNFKSADNPLVNQDNSVNPAWRNTLMHCMVAAVWNQSATPEIIAEASKGLTETIVAWQEVSPGAGAYMNEADMNEPNLQQSFYGSNYERLYDLKQKYDPWGLWYAPTAVGSEDWYITDQIPFYPTQNGRLCPVKK